MDYNAISCGVAGQNNPITEAAIEKIGGAIRELMRDGYRRFLVALTGEAALTFAEILLSVRDQYPDAGIDVLIPFDGWIEEQDSKRYKPVTAFAESVHYSCEEEYEDSMDICNRQLIGFGRCMVVIHNGTDDAMAELIEEARDAEQDIREILI